MYTYIHVYIYIYMCTYSSPQPLRSRLGSALRVVFPVPDIILLRTYTLFIYICIYIHTIVCIRVYIYIYRERERYIMPLYMCACRGKRLQARIIFTSEIIVDLQRHFPRDFQQHLPTEFHCSVVCSKGLSLVQWISTGTVQWICSGIFQWIFVFVISGVIFCPEPERPKKMETSLSGPMFAEACSGRARSAGGRSRFGMRGMRQFMMVKTL